MAVVRASDAPMTTTKPLGATSQPTLADLDALPAGSVGEMIERVLYTMTMPPTRHRWTARAIGGGLRGPFELGRGGPGGWWNTAEPGIELPNTPEISLSVPACTCQHPIDAEPA